MIKKLLVLACVVLVTQAVVHKIKVDSLGSRSAKLLKEGKPNEFRAYRLAHRQNYKAHLNRVRNAQTPNRAGRLASQPLYDYYDQAYVANVTIGTPPQNFRLLLDTFSGDTWVPDSTCDNDVCQCSQDDDPSCENKNTFDSTASSTYSKNGSPFSDPNTGGTGFLGVDTIGLGDLSVPKTTFGQLDQPYQYIKYYPFDGFLGLTYKSADNVNSVIQEAVNQGLIDQPIFTLYFQADGFDSQGKLGGQITYGAVDNEHCSADVEYVPVQSQALWEFQVDSTEIGGIKRANPVIAYADPSSSIIGITTDALSDIVQATGAQYNENYGLYQVDCSTKFNWNLSFGGNTFTVDQSNTLYDIGDGCLLLFEEFNYPGIDFLLGGPFVDDYCQVYDVTGRIGFAKVK